MAFIAIKKNCITIQTRNQLEHIFGTDECILNNKPCR